MNYGAVCNISLMEKFSSAWSAVLNLVFSLWPAHANILWLTIYSHQNEGVMNESRTSLFIFMTNDHIKESSEMWWRFFFVFFPVLANSSSQVRKYDGGSIRRLSVLARWVCPPRSARPDGEQTPLFAWHATLAITFHKIEIVSYQNSWLTSGREAVPLPRCDVENKTCGQQIHVRQISCLMASIYKPPPTPLSPPYNLFFFLSKCWLNIWVSIYKPDATTDVCEYFIPPSQKRVVTTNTLFAKAVRGVFICSEHCWICASEGPLSIEWRTMNEWMSKLKLKISVWPNR